MYTKKNQQNRLHLRNNCLSIINCLLDDRPTEQPAGHSMPPCLSSILLAAGLYFYFYCRPLKRGNSVIFNGFRLQYTFRRSAKHFSVLFVCFFSLYFAGLVFKIEKLKNIYGCTNYKSLVTCRSNNFFLEKNNSCLLKRSTFVKQQEDIFIA